MRQTKENPYLNSCVFYNQTSAQREHNKNVSVFVRRMRITQRKIVSNYCFKQCSNEYFYKIMCFLMRFITIRNNRNISIKNSKKNL